jgi:uncharacterized protein with von Willebrand factor type A (vWA) domain
MYGWIFSKYSSEDSAADFDRIFKIFKELLLYSSGDVQEALSWLTELDREYKITDKNYGIADFIEDLKQKGFIRENKNDDSGGFIPSSKMELSLRKSALNDIFGQVKKSKTGNHSTAKSGLGDEITSETRPFEFGDSNDSISFSETLSNAYINHGIDDFSLTQEDLMVQDSFHQSNSSTVLMIDISHSMILYGEDRITPAKKVAMALAELIETRYPKDTLDIITFGDDAKQIEIKDLPYY